MNQGGSQEEEHPRDKLVRAAAAASRDALQQIFNQVGLTPGEIMLVFAELQRWIAAEATHLERHGRDEDNTHPGPNGGSGRIITDPE